MVDDHAIQFLVVVVLGVVEKRNPSVPPLRALIYSKFVFGTFSSSADVAVV